MSLRSNNRYGIINSSKNKFLSICNLLNVKMEGIRMPTNYVLNDKYWHYENQSEKIASILFHIVCEYLGFNEVYQNHAGCERGYFKTSSGQLILRFPQIVKKWGNL